MSAGEVAGVRADVLALAVIAVGGCWAAWAAERLLSRPGARHPRSGPVTITADMPRPLLPFDSGDADAIAEQHAEEVAPDQVDELLAEIDEVLTKAAPPPTRLHDEPLPLFGWPDAYPHTPPAPPNPGRRSP